MHKKNSITETKRCKIHLSIALQATLPARDKLYITGNLPELGDWDPSGIPLTKTTDNIYEIDLDAPKNSIIECKLTRGSWKTQGIYDLNDVPPSNLIIKARNNQSIKIQILDWLDKQVLESDPVQGRLLDKEGFACKGLKYKRPVQVWLPKAYKEKGEPAAVIYMHDGQNLFEPSSAFAGVDWKVDETISKMIKNRELGPCIVVGIPNSPNRMQELNLLTKTGKAYAEFIINEVKPWVDSNFNVKTDPGSTVIMGSSMGGLMAFQMVCAYSQIFGLAGCLSSAFQRTYSQIFQQIKDTPKLPENIRIYLDTGEYEPPITESFLQMMDMLKEKGFVEGDNLLGYYDEKANHSEAAWARRLHIPMRFLLGKN